MLLLLLTFFKLYLNIANKLPNAVQTTAYQHSLPVVHPYVFCPVLLYSTFQCPIEKPTHWFRGPLIHYPSTSVTSCQLWPEKLSIDPSSPRITQIHLPTKRLPGGKPGDVPHFKMMPTPHKAANTKHISLGRKLSQHSLFCFLWTKSGMQAIRVLIKDFCN